MRKLAAIMFTDIQGYTALMQRDESKAVNVLEINKRIQQETIKRHHGQLIKFLGDGTLSIYPSAIHAVQCAIELQQSFLKEASLPVRIGIHLGDILYEKGDVFGDAVNIASRLEQAGIAGNVLVSGKVRDELHNHPDIPVEYLGNLQLKNVQDLTPVYAIAHPELKIPPKGSLSGDPFVNLSKKLTGDSRKQLTILFAILSVLFLAYLIGQNYFFNRDGKNNKIILAYYDLRVEGGSKLDSNRAAALSNELLEMLRQNNRLKVIEMKKQVTSMGLRPDMEELKSRFSANSLLYGLIGNIHSHGDSLFIQTELRDMSNNQIIWSKPVTFIRSKETKGISLIENVAREISKTLHLVYTDKEDKQLRSRRSENPEAQELVTNGFFALKQRDSIRIHEAIGYFQKALKLDSNYARAHAGLCMANVLLVDNGFSKPGVINESAKYHIEKAMQLDSGYAEVLTAYGLYQIAFEGKGITGERYFQRALDILPNNNSKTRQPLALEIGAQGRRQKEALQQIEKAIEDDPYSIRAYQIKWLLLVFSRDYQTASEWIDTIRLKFPDSRIVRYHLRKMQTFYYRSRSESVYLDSAIYYAEKLLPEEKRDWHLALIKGDPAQIEKEFKRLSKDEQSDLEQLAIYFISLRKQREAIEIIDQAKDYKEFWWLRFLEVDPRWDPLENDPLFLDIKEAVIEK